MPALNLACPRLYLSRSAQLRTSSRPAEALVHSLELLQLLLHVAGPQGSLVAAKLLGSASRSGPRVLTAFEDLRSRLQAALSMQEVAATASAAPTTSASGAPVAPGGVEVTGFGGKITLANTLQSRLMLAYETQLPKLRATLFA